MGFESFAPWLVLALCVFVGQAARPTDIVVEWQDKLFENILNSAKFDQQDIKAYKKAMSKLQDSWDKQEETHESEETMEHVTGALEAFSGTFMDGLTGVVEGAATPTDWKAISIGVLQIFSGALTAIGAFVPGCAVAGAVFGALTSILNFIFTIVAPKQGKTSLTTVMTRIIDYALDQFKYDELEEDFNGNLELVKATLHAFDDNFIHVKSYDDAKAVLSDLDFPAIGTKFIDFMGKTSGIMSDILSSNDPEKKDKTHIPALFNMYYHTNMNYMLLQQRALNVLSISFSNGTSGNLTIDQQVYTERLRTLRELTVDHLMGWNSTLHDFADYIFMGDPAQPASKVYLQLYSKLANHGQKGNYAVGQTDKGDGYLYGTIRENSPSLIEIQWEDDTKWKDNHIVLEGEPVSFINRNTSEGNDKNVVLMFSTKSRSWVMRYCDITAEDCYGSGNTQKIDQALFTMTRVGYDRIEPDYTSSTILPMQQPHLGPKKSGPMRSGDVVRIYNVYFSDYVMCGNYDDNSNDLTVNDDGDAWYLASMYTNYCNLDEWRIVVTGNEEIQLLANFVSSTYANLTRTGPYSTQTAGHKMVSI